MVDTHSHIDLPEFDRDRDAILNTALSAGVHAMLLVGYAPDRWMSTHHLQQLHPFIVRSVGIHPNSASVWTDTLEKQLEREISERPLVAIGEIGLDFYREQSSQELQRRAFRAQLRIAKQIGLPVIIHQREAEAETIEILEEVAPIAGVMHCFSGGLQFALRCVELGLHLGVGGVVTYPKSREIREALRSVALDSVVLETDAPYLAPQGYRGKRNQPDLIRVALTTLAEIHEQEPDAVASVTSSNAEELFGSELSRARAIGMELAECRS